MQFMEKMDTGVQKTSSVFTQKKKDAEATKNLMMEQLYEKNKDNTGIEFGIMEIDANDLVDLWRLN